MLFEGCCEDRPRPCHQLTSSSPHLHSRTTLESKLRAFHKPTNTQTLAHSHTHSRLPAHLPAARGDQTGTRCLAQGHTQMGTQAHTQEWRQQIASKVIDRTLWEGTAPVQLQSLLSLGEISHGQSELQPWRNLLETCDVMLFPVLAIQLRRPQNSLPIEND